MVRMVPDSTGRFPERPHYRPQEIDRECEKLIRQFLRDLHDEMRFPVMTDDLTKLIERDADDLDLYADLSHLGPSVEAVTEFHRRRKPVVRVSAKLSNSPHRENRLRTTLTHEYGHVHFHAYLWAMRPSEACRFNPCAAAGPMHCKRESMLNAPETDWMEWQAGYVSGALLMPRSHLGQLVTEYQKQKGLSEPMSVDSAHAQALVAMLVDAYQVSQEAARVRLTKLGYLETKHGSSRFG